MGSTHCIVCSSIQSEAGSGWLLCQCEWRITAEQERGQAMNKAMNRTSGKVGWVPWGSMGRWDGDHLVWRELWMECLC